MVLVGIAVFRGRAWSRKGIVLVSTYWLAYELLWRVGLERVFDDIAYWLEPVAPWFVYVGISAGLGVLALMVTRAEAKG